MEYCILIILFISANLNNTIASNQATSQARVRKVTLDFSFKLKLMLD